MKAPVFRSPDFLREHARRIMAFYRPRCVDPSGGFYHYYRDDGSVYERHYHHLVSSTRFIVNFARCYREFGDPADLERLRHGLEYLRKAHRDHDSGGYFWTLRDDQPEDRTQHAYGMAFVLLAYARCLQAGIDAARGWLEETWNLLEAHFWDPEAGLYRDEADTHWQFSDYRGQNANMHLCEALLAAFEASGQRHYLDRALRLADHITRRQTAATGGLVWEHYDQHWQVDWNYNRDHPKHLFRPWGFQPGHQTEWAKLLLALERHGPQDWLSTRAQSLFDAAVARAWDDKYGGLYYGFAPDGTICDDDKYYWVQAESLAAAAHLAIRTGRDEYWQWYDRLWDYAWRHLVDHHYGAWYRILTRRNQSYSDEKSPAGKTDYHTFGACLDVLGMLRAAPAQDTSGHHR